MAVASAPADQLVTPMIPSKNGRQAVVALTTTPAAEGGMEPLPDSSRHFSRAVDVLGADKVGTVCGQGELDRAQHVRSGARAGRLSREVLADDAAAGDSGEVGCVLRRATLGERVAGVDHEPDHQQDHGQ